MRLTGLFLLTLMLGACASLPTDVGPFPEETASAPGRNGILTSINDSIALSEGKNRSGFWLLDNNAEALHWRLALVDSAESSLDLLYYLWYAHASGRLLLERVFRAADRGVRVQAAWSMIFSSLAATRPWSPLTGIPTSSCACSTPSSNARPAWSSTSLGALSR